MTRILVQEAGQLGVELVESQAQQLEQFLDLMLVWNRKVNLTAIRDRAEAVEGHLVDAMGAVRAVRGAKTVLDLGAGGGVPSIPLAVVLPGTRFLMVDSVGKKVGFLKAVIAQLGLKNAQARQARAEGRPADEGIEQCELAICRAFLPLREWLSLAGHYVVPGGRVAAMLGPESEVPERVEWRSVASGINGKGEEWRLMGVDDYRLPRSGAVRRVAVYTKS